MAKNLTPAHLRCIDDGKCPSIHELEDGRLLIIGSQPEDGYTWPPHGAAAGDDESWIIISRELLANLSPWPLIGTAPKDGTYVLTGRAGDKFPLILHWLHLAWRDWNGVMHEPTHWQPLPLPPELIDRELLSGLDSALRTGEESKSGVDVAEEAKGGF